jgi:hypothetical protein
VSTAAPASLLVPEDDALAWAARLASLVANASLAADGSPEDLDRAGALTACVRALWALIDVASADARTKQVLADSVVQEGAFWPLLAMLQLKVAYHAELERDVAQLARELARKERALTRARAEAQRARHDAAPHALPLEQQLATQAELRARSTSAGGTPAAGSLAAAATAAARVVRLERAVDAAEDAAAALRDRMRMLMGALSAYAGLRNAAAMLLVSTLSAFDTAGLATFCFGVPKDVLLALRGAVAARASLEREDGSRLLGQADRLGDIADAILSCANDAE